MGKILVTFIIFPGTCVYAFFRLYYFYPAKYIYIRICPKAAFHVMYDTLVAAGLNPEPETGDYERSQYVPDHNRR